MTNETSYETVVLTKDTGVIRGLTIDGDHKQELSPDSIARLDELKEGMQCKVSSFDI